MRDQWRRSDSRGQGNGRERSRGRRKPDRKKGLEDDTQRGGRPRRSVRKRRLEELARDEADSMLKQMENSSGEL